MKLYATIQAQKLQDGKLITVKKAQGSNTNLDIDITNGTGGLIAYVQVMHRRDALPMVYFVPVLHHAYATYNNEERSAIMKLEETKGKQKKDEKCYCSDDDMSIPHYH